MDSAMVEMSSSTERVLEKNIENKQLLTLKILLLQGRVDRMRQILAPIVPIRNFSSLCIGVPYLVRRIKPITVGKKNTDASSRNNWEFQHYAQLGTLAEPLIHVWLSPLMVIQSKNYQLGMENVYLISLGKHVRMWWNGYQDFVIVPANQAHMFA